MEQVGKTGSVSVSASSAAAPRWSERVERALRKWHAETATAALAFEARWTFLALRRVDADIAERLFEQRSRYDRACMTGTADEIEEEGAALCRGYVAAVAALQAASVEDDAYLVGRCPLTGITVAISGQRAAVVRVRELYGDEVIWLTPDEIATLVASGEQFKAIATVKRKFPGAEVIDRHAM